MEKLEKLYEIVDKVKQRNLVSDEEIVEALCILQEIRNTVGDSETKLMAFAIQKRIPKTYHKDTKLKLELKSHRKTAYNIENIHKAFNADSRISDFCNIIDINESKAKTGLHPNDFMWSIIRRNSVELPTDIILVEINKMTEKELKENKIVEKKLDI